MQSKYEPKEYMIRTIIYIYIIVEETNKTKFALGIVQFNNGTSAVELASCIYTPQVVGF